MNLHGERQGYDGEFAYHMLRSALDRYRCNLSELDEDQLRQVREKASKSYELESLVLSSEEARDLIIPDELVERAMSEVAGRYPSEEEFVEDLRANGLGHDALRGALHRELIFDAVMQRVAARSADINDIDVRLFYEMHGDRFASAETRTARHILVTVNPDYPENTPAMAQARIQEAVRRLKGKPNRFHDIARRYSECPTAMEGGRLGEVRKGVLYPELDACLFSLQEGEISDVIESEMGFHILYCEKIKPGKRLAFSKAAPRIRELLKKRRARNCQKAWLAALQEHRTGEVDDRR